MLLVKELLINLSRIAAINAVASALLVLGFTLNTLCISEGLSMWLSELNPLVQRAHVYMYCPLLFFACFCTDSFTSTLVTKSQIGLHTCSPFSLNYLVEDGEIVTKDIVIDIIMMMKMIIEK